VGAAAEGARRVAVDEVRALAELAGVRLDPDRLAGVAAILAAIAADLSGFETLDLDGVEPELAFRASWDS
jgi:hypothetical protein